jgi:hypothetical protein
VLVDHVNFLETILNILKTSGVRYCVIDGTGVNAYAYPVVTEDLDIVVAAEDIEALGDVLTQSFHVKRFPHSINVSATGSKLQVQIQTDPRYFPYDDILQGKIWAAMDPERRRSKRQKDLGN